MILLLMKYNIMYVHGSQFKAVLVILCRNVTDTIIIIVYSYNFIPLSVLIATLMVEILRAFFVTFPS